MRPWLSPTRTSGDHTTQSSRRTTGPTAASHHQPEHVVDLADHRCLHSGCGVRSGAVDVAVAIGSAAREDAHARARAWHARRNHATAGSARRTAARVNCRLARNSSRWCSVRPIGSACNASRRPRHSGSPAQTRCERRTDRRLDMGVARRPATRSIGSASAKSFASCRTTRSRARRTRAKWPVGGANERPRRTPKRASIQLHGVLQNLAEIQLLADAAATALEASDDPVGDASTRQ